MKQALVLLIFISLYSFLSAIQCEKSQLIGCKNNYDISSCSCYPSSYYTGTFVLVHKCSNYYYRPTCTKSSLYINCFCS